MNSERMDPAFEAFSDNALMLRVRDGDIDKMGLLYERYHMQLYRFIFNMTRQKELSEDMVHNTFIRMLRYPDGFNGSGEFRIWMYHIARNALKDYYRKSPRSRTTADIADYKEHLQSDNTSDGDVEREEEVKMLARAMEELSIENRELLVLCRFQEMKYNEIAILLNTTEGAIKVRVHRAMNQLRNNFMNIRK